MATIELAPEAGRSRWGGVAVGVGAVFATWVLGLLGPASFLVPVIPVGLILRRRIWAAALCLLLSPIGVWFTNGVVGYCRGQAELMFEGLPGTEAHNLDPELRCGRASSGCLVSGGEWLTHGANNAAVRLMTRWFGPQPGTYRGPYPTRDQALGAVAGGEAVPVAAMRADAIKVGGRVVRLDAGVGAGLLRAAGAMYDPMWTADDLKMVEKEMGPIRAAVWRDSCLIVRVPVGSEGEDGSPSACVAVCDLGTGRPFAYYAEGKYYHRYPPVTWRR